ncbi:MAG: hypothetical protein C0498_08855 [Anaerolinea sp.]|nr:hypothetical protein [Anaerolinea sp.]
MNTRSVLSLLVGVVFLVAACSSGSGVSPTPAAPSPTPTPVGAAVESPEDAAALVIAADPRFAGMSRRSPDVIGASGWWEAEPLDGGGYRIKMTIGWGDCPAGCINRHTWTFDVSAGGEVRLVEEAGDPLPAGVFPPN